VRLSPTVVTTSHYIYMEFTFTITVTHYNYISLKALQIQVTVTRPLLPILAIEIPRIDFDQARSRKGYRLKVKLKVINERST
jgi:hypothetical protein